MQEQQSRPLFLIPENTMKFRFVLVFAILLVAAALPTRAQKETPPPTFAIKAGKSEVKLF